MKYEANVRMFKGGRTQLFTEPTAQHMETRGWTRQEIEAAPATKVRVLKEPKIEPKIEEVINEVPAEEAEQQPKAEAKSKPSRGRKKKVAE